jgi:hypothetical protein
MRIAPFCVVASSAAFAFANTTSYPSAKVAFDAPSGWTTTIKPDQVIVADAPGDVAASFVVVPSGAIDQAAHAAGEALGKLITGIKVLDDQKVTINGMKAELIGGDGRLHGSTDIDWMVAVVDTPATDKDLMVIVIAEDAKLAAHKPEVNYLIQHIRPLP